ncbi:DUF5067 domain-containing protein [Gordonibacter sp. Marseille-P4307]|uniref:DUF5067 domain-containing protein n=1 Tax=Gordonibacter sp. Marseille-P4307 TaxID=2161815 RepID=UPI000F5449B8|nr:DUF5067 domain-containing protein [Gordonibacter sp. Marseille-P4307]
MEQSSLAPDQRPTPKGTSGSAIAALVLGVLALASSFIPIVNNLSFVFAIVGIILAIVGLVGIGKGKKTGKGLAVAALIVSIIAIVVVLATQSLYSAAIDKAMERTQVENTAEQASTPSSATESGTAEKADDSNKTKYQVSIDSSEVTQDYSGKNAIVVTYTWKNMTDDSTSFSGNVIPRAFQNGVQLDRAVVRDLDGSKALSQVKPGSEVTVKQAYQLTDASEVTVEVSPLISFNKDKDILVTKKFSVE